LRGALGFLLDESLFRPHAEAGPSGLHDPPRPFSLRCSHLDGLSVEPGQPFSVRLMVFWLDPAPWIEAFRRLDWAELENVSSTPRDYELAPTPACQALRVEFLTPTELKPTLAPGSLPAFDVLVGRVRDRIAALRRFYGPGPLEVDFRGLGARARAVRAVDGRIEWVEASRISSRSHQTHPLGGFEGWVDYAGQLGEFVPWLEAGRATGVGRQTVWGKGVIHLIESGQSWSPQSF
jgi:hypothetical protein